MQSFLIPCEWRAHCNGRVVVEVNADGELRVVERDRRRLDPPVCPPRVIRNGRVMADLHHGSGEPPDYCFVHWMAWRAWGNGPVPPRRTVGFRDGDMTNTRPDNLHVVMGDDLRRQHARDLNEFLTPAQRGTSRSAV